MITLEKIKQRFEETFKRHYDPWIAAAFAEECIPELIERIEELEKNWYASNKAIRELEGRSVENPDVTKRFMRKKKPKS
jgi:hypothetical protein